MRRLRILPAGSLVLVAFFLPHFGFALRADTVESHNTKNTTADELAAAVGIKGGLCVQVGAAKTDLASDLAGTGRFLVQLLDAEEAVVEAARRSLQKSKAYGLVSVNRLPKQGHLPYTENLVNLLIVSAGSPAQLAPQEIFRVLCPGGIVLIADGTTTADRLKAAGFVAVRGVSQWGVWLAGKKPWPAGMDQWTHPRHSASGNAVSRDTLVAPPRRLRWVAGAQAEVRGMVTANGRNFYAGVLARDSFNGLRLWRTDLVGPPSTTRFSMKNLGPDNVSPVACGDRVYVVREKKLMALDAATGEVACEYPEAGQPRSVLFEGGTLVVATNDSVRAVDATSAALKWSFSSSDPKHLVAGGDTVAMIQGRIQRGEPAEAVISTLATGEVRWKNAEFPWLPEVTRLVYHQDMVAFEVSTLDDHGPGNAIHLISASDGSVQLDHPFLPGMNHIRQARAMFVGDRLWLLHGGKGKDDHRYPTQVSAIDFRTGEVQATHRAGLAHCFPPVMTTQYMLSGEFDLTDLKTGQVDAHQITKAACGRDGGWVPANGLIYVTPKHCVCWPMLRGYLALAPQRPTGSVADMELDQTTFPLEAGGAPPPEAATATSDDDWPCYRHDPWRSGSTPVEGPSHLDVVWSAELGGHEPSGPVVEDWQENPFVKGPISSPVITGGHVVVTRPDAHEVVALDAASGAVRWRFTADGRVDTAPTIHNGLCLFGTKNGWVHCLRLDDGRTVWRLRAAPLDEQITAYGQLESPWPVPGSVLVWDDVVYFAAGRQSLADGGVLIFAVEPANGRIRWVRRLDSVPQKGFYECSGLEFDNFDLLHREGDKVGMSRWTFDRETGDMSLDRWSGFAKLDTGDGAAMVPRGCWSYAPRHQRRIRSFTARRPLAAFRDNTLYGCLQGTTAIYRRDFQLDADEKFDTRWITGWAASTLSRNGKMPWRSHRLAEKATWQVDVFDKEAAGPSIDAMLLAGQRLFVAGSNGDLRILATADGKQLAKQSLPEPLWDGMAIAGQRLYYATRDGRLLCLGKRDD